MTDSKRTNYWMAPGIVLLVSAVSISALFGLLAGLPAWFCSVAEAEVGGSLYDAFPLLAFAGILLLSFPLLQLLLSLAVIAIFELDRVHDRLSLGLRFSAFLRSVLLLPIIFGLNLLHAWLCFGSLTSWPVWLLILLGTAITRYAAYATRIF
jgi:hypothetical protein